VIETFASPTRVGEISRFDAETLSGAAAYLGAGQGTILFVVDPRPFPVRDAAIAELAKTKNIAVLDRVVPDPKSADIDAMAEAARELKPEIVIGIGGGSTLDSAKAAAMLLANGGSLDDYLGPNASRVAEKKGPLLVLIPTTAGTGSEVTRFGVYTARTGRKYTLASPLLRADAALLCEELVASLPAPLVAMAGYDALTHALETLWNKNATPLSDLLAEKALAAVYENLRAAWEESNGRTVKKNSSSACFGLLRAANAAGVAFDKTGTAAIHALSFILSEEWHLPHGAACAFFTGAIYSRNSKEAAVAAKLARVARRTGTAAETDSDSTAAAKLGDAFETLRADLKLAARFAELEGFGQTTDARKTAEIVARFGTSLDDPKMKNNIVPMDAESVRAVLEEKLP